VRQSRALRRFGGVNRPLRSPLSRAGRDLRLTNSFKVAILASKLPEIWRMSDYRCQGPLKCSRGV
jgi:hypothetical protein